MDGTVRDGIGGYPEPLHLLADLGGQDIGHHHDRGACGWPASWRAGGAGRHWPALRCPRRWRSPSSFSSRSSGGPSAATPASPAGMPPPCSRWPPPARCCWPARRARACRAPCGCCWYSVRRSSRPPSATAMVALGYHYFTDIVAGTAVGVGMVLLTALLIDWAARSPRAWRPARRPGDTPVTSRRSPKHDRSPGCRGRVPPCGGPGHLGRQSRGFPANRMPPERNREAMDDDALIAAVARGDDVALRELFARHAPWLAGRLRGVLPAAEVEDVLQETFLAVWRGAGGYRPGFRGRLAVGDRPAAGGAVAAPPRAGRAAPARPGRRRTGSAATRPRRRSPGPSWPVRSARSGRRAARPARPGG